MIGPKAFRRIADLVFRTSKADHTTATMDAREGQTARFANNQIVQNVHTSKNVLSVTTAFGTRKGSSSTTDLTPQGIVGVVQRAILTARFAPEDPEYLPPLPQQTYPERDTYRQETANADPWRLLDDVKTAVALCKEKGLSGAGYVSAFETGFGVAANDGLFAFEPRTRADFSLTATATDSTGWARNVHRSIDKLGVEELVRVAVGKALRSAEPKEIPAGKYTVILEPAAVAGLLGPLRWVADARSYYRGTSALAGKLGQPIVDPRLTLRNDGGDPRLLGNGFNGEGLPGNDAVWIDKGVLKQLVYDRWSAREHGAAPSYPLDAPHLSGEGATSDLLKGVERAILVTNFWYIRFVNRGDLTLTGMTRDGTFLVEDGKITTGLRNFRFHESPLRALNRIEAFGQATDAISTDRLKWLLPPMRLGEFNFSSVTKF